MLLKTGAILLTISSGFNALLASAILTILIIFKKNAPFLYIVFDETAISQLNSKIIAMTNSLAVLFNASAASFSILSIYVI